MKYLPDYAKISSSSNISEYSDEEPKMTSTSSRRQSVTERWDSKSRVEMLAKIGQVYHQFSVRYYTIVCIKLSYVFSVTIPWGCMQTQP